MVQQRIVSVLRGAVVATLSLLLAACAPEIVKSKPDEDGCVHIVVTYMFSRVYDGYHCEGDEPVEIIIGADTMTIPAPEAN